MHFHILITLIAAPLLILAIPPWGGGPCGSAAKIQVNSDMQHAAKYPGKDQVAQCFIEPECHFGRSTQDNIEIWGKLWSSNQTNELKGEIAESCGGVDNWVVTDGGQMVSQIGRERRGWDTGYEFRAHGNATDKDLAGCVKNAIMKILKVKGDGEGKVGDCVYIRFE